jgi:SAM-dependent methyltransferase
VRERAPEVARDIRSVAGAAQKEVDLVAECEKLLDKFAKSFGHDLSLSRERTLVQGYADAVYNRFVIEYEPPLSLTAKNDSARNRHAVQQVKDYMKGVAQRDRHDIARMAGVALDGRYFIFVRWRDGLWSIDEPVPVTEQSTRTFLRYLLSLSTELALTPESLVRDFGEGSQVAREVVPQLCAALHSTKSPKAKVLFKQWLLLFDEVTGYGSTSQQLPADALAAAYGVKPADLDMDALLFALHTYYALFIKLLALQIANFFLMPKMGSRLASVGTYDEGKLKRYLQDLESGGLFAQLGIKNFLEGDFFTWYLEVWSPEVFHAMQELVSQLARYSLVTLDVDPEETRDLLKQLYQNLMPKKLRHALGEYYTPDWLADRLLGQMNYSGDLSKRLLDPACGSGTFLVLAIRKARQKAEEDLLPAAKVLEAVLGNVVGFDLNPLAVISARTNYLLALGDLIEHRTRDVSIPVYLADSILTPAHGGSLLDASSRTVRTAVGDLPVPHSLDSRAAIDDFTDYVEKSVHSDLPADAFLRRCSEVHGFDSLELGVAGELYERLLALERNGMNGVWARILRNAFAPLLEDEFDFVAGNPPWVNWESLPSEYRRDTIQLWTEHNLFPHHGFETILGKGKKDISMLMTFVAADRYLRAGGKLGFIITQSLLKSAGAGAGFRRLTPASGCPLCAYMVDDMVDISPFEGASNRTAVLVLVKGKKTRYPVPYNLWSKKVAGRVPESAALREVLGRCRVSHLYAQPVDPDDESSSWVTGRRRSLRALEKVLGKSDYQARAGASTWMNGVYWLRVEGPAPGGLLVRNVPDAGKADLDEVQAVVEADLVYPLLRAGDVVRWHGCPHLDTLMVQDLKTRRGYDEDWLKEHYPRTYSYLLRFKDQLLSRSGYKRYFKPGDPFYSMFNVASYTFASYKVVFPSIGTELQSAVVASHGEKSIVPQHIVTLVPLDNEDEAHYVCACLNSSPARFALEAYSQKGGKSFATPQALEHIKIPAYSSTDEVHAALAECSRAAHQAAAADDPASLTAAEAGVDELAGKVWHLAAAELQDLQTSLAEKRPKSSAKPATEPFF